MDLRAVASLSNQALLSELAELVSRERQATVALIVYLGEVDARRLYLPAGYSSMHEYCVRVLHMSDEATYKRIRVARKGRLYPAILDALTAGRLHLSAVVSLAAHLSPANVDELIAEATHKTRDEVDVMLPRRFPQPDVATLVRVIPAPRVDGLPQVRQAQTANTQLSPGTVIFTDAEHSPMVSASEQPSQHPAPIAPLPPPRPRVTPLAPGRRPGPVRCAPRSGGGHATASGLRLRCRAHNQYEAERVFGEKFMAHKREQARQASATSGLAGNRGAHRPQAANNGNP